MLSKHLYFLYIRNPLFPIAVFISMSLVTNYGGGGGGATKREGGACELLPLRKGGAEKVLAMLKGGHTKFWGRFYVVA